MRPDPGVTASSGLRGRWQQWLQAVLDAFWFLPALMAALAVAAALGSVALDHHVGARWLRSLTLVWSGGADGARSTLSVVATSVMTVVSIVFSITITTLAQTSSHFGPRVLRNFTSDRSVQATLGTFVATFVYCLLVLRTVHSQEGSSFVPYVSVNFGLLLALASLALLIYFIHHVVEIIQAENLIAGVGRDFEAQLPGLLPEQRSPRQALREAKPPDWQQGVVVEAGRSGYVQHVDYDRLLQLATAQDLQLCLTVRSGDFLACGAPLLQLLPREAAREQEDALRSCFLLGAHRTPRHDPLYTLRQLVEIAAHALSPGINEPFTALNCIDWIGAALRGVVRRTLPPGAQYDHAGKLRLLRRELLFAEMAATAFEQIRLCGASNPAVMNALLQAIATLAPELQRSEDRDILLYHARLVADDTERQLGNAEDRRQVAAQLQRTLQALLARELPQLTSAPPGLTPGRVGY